MNFAEPLYLDLLWGLPLVALILAWGMHRRRVRLQLLASRPALQRLLPRVSPWRLWLRAGLFLVAIAAVALALARPRWGFLWKDVSRSGVDIMLALDVSRSMLATDIKPDRLSRARREIIDLIRMLRGDRIGLIAFAGIGFVQCPLTIDYGAVSLFLDHLDEDLIPVPGTSLGDAIRIGMQSLEDGSTGGEDAAGKAIILITDGEDQDSDPMAAAAEAKKKGIKIFTIGIGAAEGAPIPEQGGGYKKDGQGNLVVTRLDEDVLKKIALETGGMYHRSLSGDLDLERIYLQGIRAEMSSGEIHKSRQKIWYERSHWFALVALLLLMLEMMIPPAGRLPPPARSGA